jgi:heavy metal translocating P-type ATPase
VSNFEPLPALLDYAGEIASANEGGPLALVRAGSGRAHIRGARPGAPGVNALLAWLGERAEVVRVEHREALAAIEVDYSEPSARNGAPGASGTSSASGVEGSFVRSLRDRLFTLGEPSATIEPRVELAHALTGRVRLRLRGATDDAVARLASLLGEHEGVSRATASLASQSVLVTFDPALTSAEALLRTSLATSPSAWPATTAPPKKTGWRLAAMNSVVLGATLTGALPLPAIAAAVSITALPAARRALHAAHERRISVDILDLAAIGISLGTGQPTTAAFITWLLGVGDLVLEQTQDRARSAISKLMKLDADHAFRLLEGSDGVAEQVEQVSATRLAIGDRIVVESGGRVAADGVIVRGLASVDEKALTGESLPRERRVGDKVLAATVVVEGQLVVLVERTGRDTTAAKIVQILEGAGAKPMTLQRETERTADRLVLPTIGLAGSAALFAQQIDRMTSVLITDFGTGIRIAVPTSALTAMTLAAHQGVLVKGAQYLERLAKADCIVFDKTGTLTTGCPQVFEVALMSHLSAAEVVALAASAERRQAHPIAEAIRDHARTLGVTVPDADFGSESYAIGLGLSATVRGRVVLVGGPRLMAKHGIDVAPSAEARARHAAGGASSICVAIDGTLAAIIGYRDEPRPESFAVVRALKAGGRRQIVLMSGDARAPVEAVAKAIGVDRAYAEMLPEDKAARVRELQKQGKTVAMVGDGINDAPALAVADVGISLHGGTDVALETADVVLLDAGLAKLPDAFAVADDAMRRVRLGLGYVIVPNAIAIVLGAVGLLSPGGAALINNGSTVVASLAAVAPLLRRRR